MRARSGAWPRTTSVCRSPDGPGAARRAPPRRHVCRRGSSRPQNCRNDDRLVRHTRGSRPAGLRACSPRDPGHIEPLAEPHEGDPVFVPLSVLEFRDRAATFFGDKVGVIDGERRVHLSRLRRAHAPARERAPRARRRARRPRLVHHLQHAPPARGVLRGARGRAPSSTRSTSAWRRTRSPTSSTTPDRRSSSSTATSRRSSRRSRPR